MDGNLKDLQVQNFSLLDMFKPVQLCTPKLLGKGSYGSVVSVVGRLDNKVYALKRIRLRERSARRSRKTLREVSILSQLSHPNVVRYYNAWVQRHETKNEVHFTDSKQKQKKGKEALFHAFGSDNDETLESDSDSDTEDDVSGVPLHLLDGRNILECYLCKDNYEDFEVHIDAWRTIERELQGVNLCIPCFLKHYQTTENSTNAVPQSIHYTKHKLRRPPLYLYVQMEFCDTTLDNFMNSFREQHPPATWTETETGTLWNLMVQLARGLGYLHSVHVIHRDLKPANIFVNNDLTIKIGDLGSAIAGSGQSIKEDATPTVDPTRSTVGTYLYLSPESVQRSLFTSKSDIYSFGIIVLEMFCGHHFVTRMERTIFLENLARLELNTKMQNCLPPIEGDEEIEDSIQKVNGSKNKNAPRIISPPKWWKSFCMENERAASLFLSMLNYDPEKRPLAREVLHRVIDITNWKRDIIPEGLCSNCEGFKEELQRLRTENHALRKELRKLKASITPKS